MGCEYHEKSADCGFGVILKKSDAIRRYTSENGTSYINIWVEWKLA